MRDPVYYRRGRIEVWDFIVDQGLDFLLGNVIKYVCRAGHKTDDMRDDLLKAKSYIDKALEGLDEQRDTTDTRAAVDI